jgi:hypothetical protein
MRLVDFSGVGVHGAAPSSPARLGDNLHLKIVFKIQNVCYVYFCSPDRSRSDRQCEMADAAAVCTTWQASRSGGEFFSFFRCNALKSPDSSKGIQKKCKIFSWISLDPLARNSPAGCTGD